MMTGILSDSGYVPMDRGFNTTGPRVEAAQPQGQGLILVSGNFGQREVILHSLRTRDTEIGALYLLNSNPYYEPLRRKVIKVAGKRIIPKELQEARKCSSSRKTEVHWRCWWTNT